MVSLVQGKQKEELWIYGRRVNLRSEKGMADLRRRHGLGRLRTAHVAYQTGGAGTAARPGMAGRLGFCDMYVPLTICFFLILDWHVVAHLPRKGGDVTVSGLVQYAVMTWNLGVHLGTSPRCLRNLVVLLAS